MSSSTRNNTSSEHSLHPRFYKILDLPPCPLSKVETAYHFRHYLEKTGAYVTSADGQDQYIMITKDVSILSGLDEGDTYTLKEAGEQRRHFYDFVRIVWQRIRIASR
jgi:hypothetical protein